MGKCPITGRVGSGAADPYRIEMEHEGTKTSKSDILRMLRPFYWPGEPGDSKHKTAWLRTFVVLALVCLFCGKVCNLLGPFFMGKMVTSLSKLDSTEALKYLIIGAVMYLIGTALDESRNLLYSYVQVHGTTTLAHTFYRHLHSMDYQFFVETKSGETIRCMTRGLEAVRELTRFGVLLMVPTMMEAVAVCIVFAAYYRHVWLALTLIAGLALYVTLTIVGTNWRNKTRTAEAQRDDDMHNISNDGLNNFDTVKYYTNEKYEVDRYMTAVRQHQWCQWRVLTSLSMLNVSQEVVKQITICLSLLFGVLAVLDKRLVVGDVVAIQTYLIVLYRPLYLLGTMYAMVCRALAGLQSAANMLLNEPMTVDKEGAQELSIELTTASDLPMVEFENVSFSYPSLSGSGTRLTLDNVSFRLPKGKSLAIVGPTGTGKTTLSLLLCRMYDVSSGRILVNGVDIATVTQESLRRSIGVVSQSTVLFHATLRDNIRYAKLDATDEEIYEALRRASLLERVLAFPERLDTVVGERGMRLSGGEKQRVSIARCFLKDPPIIILDEATSSLDSKTEAEIQSTLHMLFRNRTVLTIAHRLSTIVDCDTILYMEKGRVKQLGSHAELLQQGGGYKDLWEAQLGGSAGAP
ncbi:ABC transporter [Babesia caballi]|uniref:ABC transporter n=1 Tax=Babesia caballi TaxID=5871 RepID=A0AAV4LY48_BABCB|nr:ABC transporter [Babesia caballi]